MTVISMKMKNINYFMNRRYKLEIVPDLEEGGFVAYYPELPGCITCSDTFEGVIKNAEDAKREWIQTALDDGRNI